MVSLTAGFALSVLPVSAQTITTDSNGLVAGEVKIPVQGGEIPAYRAMPATGGPFPTILVVHEIFGVHEHIKDICRRLAKVGYFAVAPYLYAREGDVTGMKSMQEVLPIVRKVPEPQVASDLDATVAWAKSTGKADTSRPRHHRILLGRAPGVALCGAQSGFEGRRWHGTGRCNFPKSDMRR